MRRADVRLFVVVCAVCALMGVVARSMRTKGVAVMAAAPSSGCSFPSKAAATPEETSWQLFVAANCPTNDPSAPLAWEAWPTQEQVFTTNNVTNNAGVAISGKGQRFHPTVQGRLLKQKTVAAMAQLNAKQLLVTNQCTTPKGRTICEEVRLNPAAAKYVEQNGLNTRTGQGKFVGAGNVMNFPADAVELKADWLEGCSDASLHVETVGGKSYCLIAMHISSKLVPNWVWATWESDSDTENPNRCVSVGCSDAFGSLPAVIAAGVGAKKARKMAMQTSALAGMEKAAGLSAQMAHYTMNGAQVEYMDGSSATLLGNSITEEELVDVPLTKSSCITCHKVSAINAQGVQYMTALKATPIGNASALPAGYYLRDFVWAMVVAPK